MQDEATNHANTSQQMTNRSRTTECRLKKRQSDATPASFDAVNNEKWQYRCDKQGHERRARCTSGRSLRRDQELTSSSSLMATRRHAEGGTHVCSLHLSLHLTSEEKPLVEEGDAKQARKTRRRGLPLKTYPCVKSDGPGPSE